MAKIYNLYATENQPRYLKKVIVLLQVWYSVHKKIFYSSKLHGAKGKCSHLYTVYIGEKIKKLYLHLTAAFQSVLEEISSHHQHEW